MDAYDVLIVGGGPAGSTCAWRLRAAGLRVAIVDRARFPRNKICGGWITPAVVYGLELDTQEYARGRVLQPVTGFVTGAMGGRAIETRYGRTVSWGIRRFEFDDYLLRRSGAAVYQGEARIERMDGEWVIDGHLRAPALVGAGGTYCPVARMLGARAREEALVVAQEAEFPAGPDCRVRGDTPELYFCRDMKGYGWLFRKQDVLNVGLGRLDARGLAGHVREFLRWAGIEAPQPRGHAYLIHGITPRRIAGRGALLIGDAAGLAHPISGEGIRPAVESARMAAEAIVAGDFEGYPARIAGRFGKGSGWGKALPGAWTASLGRRLLE
jgi:geranylgeranyl reductase family protein